MIKKLLFFGILSLSFSLSSQITKVKEINNETNKSSSPAHLTVVNDKLYFAADDSNGSNTPGATDLGKELWVTDGTEAETNFVKDIKTGSSSSGPRELFVFNNKLYFTANDDLGANLWTTDGTETGTNNAGLFAGVNESLQRPIAFDGKVYLTGISTDGDTNDLIIFDGNTAVNANTTADDESILSTMAVLNGKLYAYMNLGSDNLNDEKVDVDAQNNVGNELYSFDKSTGTFSLVKDIALGATLNSSSGEYRSNDSSISNLTSLGSKIYFEALGELWETDGTAVGTIKVSVAANATLDKVTSFYAWNNKLYLEGDDGTSEDQLFVYDPANDSLTNLSNTQDTNGANKDHNPGDYAVYNNYLYYSAQDADDTGKHIWRTNGTSVEQLDATIKDVDEITLFNNKLYFEGDNGTTGNELYVLDPNTLAITKVLLTNISVYPNPSNGIINVSHKLDSEITFNISDLSGRLVLKGKLIDNKIKHSLNSGVYLLKLSTKSANKTQKIVIE